MVNDEASGGLSPWLVLNLMAGVAEEVEFAEECLLEDFSRGDGGTRRVQGLGSVVELGGGGRDGLAACVEVLGDVRAEPVACERTCQYVVEPDS